MATSFPGATGMLPNDVAGIGQVLQHNGYSTAAFGKWHETAVWEISPSGPMARWPNAQGFDEFYGFLGGETNQWSPGLFHNQNQIETPDDPDYHFMNDMATKSIEWMRFQQALTPDKPFFVYFAPGAVHAPHHVPKSYIDKQKGKFDEGWDVIRKRIYEQQKKLGVIPKDTKLAEKPEDIKDWKELSANEKKLFARQAEVFAAYLDMADHETGRVIQAIEDMGELDNTLIFYIAGDNGTSAEGLMNGLYNEYTYFNNVAKGSDIDYMLEHYDEWGGPSTYPHMAAGWAVCFDSPFTWTKQVASNYGGTRNAMVVHWPERIKAKGEIRCSGTTSSTSCRPFSRRPACPNRGSSTARPSAHRGREHDVQLRQAQTAQPSSGPVLRDVRQPRHLLRRLVRRHGAPQALGQGGEPIPRRHLGAVPRAGRLQHVDGPGQEAPRDARRIAGGLPRRGGEVQGLAPRRSPQELFNPKLAGRPDLMFGRKKLTLYEGMTGMLENDFINTKNTSFEIVAEIETGDKPANGVIVSQGGRFGGWSLYVKDGKPKYTYNYVGIDLSTVHGHRSLPRARRP